MEAWTGFMWLKIGSDGGFFKCGNEPSDFIKFGEFILLAS
jgi:hypothetical protein